MIELLSALVVWLGARQASNLPPAEIFVRTSPAVSIERLATAVRSFGTIESRRRGTRTYRILLKPGCDDEVARERLEKFPGVHPLEQSEEPLDLLSVHSLTNRIEFLEKGDQEDDRTNANKKHEEVDYLKAYRYFVSQRAFPEDRVNWSALELGRTHASRMATTKLGSSSHRAMTNQTWQFVGPTNLQAPYEQYYGIGPVNGRINAVAYDPNNSNIIYAGAAQGGLWRSADGGSTWTWLSNSWPMLGINCIVVDPNNGSVIYVGLGDYHGQIAGSYGIMKTTDGGVTWAEISSASTGKVGVASILMDPTNDQTLIAGTGDIASIDTSSYGSLYRSTNAGKTWTALNVGGNSSTWPTLAASAPSGSTVRFYAVAGGLGPSGTGSSRLVKSDDHGATWQPLASPVVTDGNFHFAYAVTTSPTNPNNVYLLDSEDEYDFQTNKVLNHALFTSSNQGANWIDVSANLPSGNDIGAYYNFSQSWYDYHLVCGTRMTGSTPNDLLFLGEIDLTESADGGSTWTSIGGPTYEENGISHNDQHCLAVCPTNPSQALFGNDGGVYSLSYSGETGLNTVVSLNKFLGNSMFYKIAFDPTKPNFMLGGTQDNATPLSTGDISNWLNIGGGDGGGCAINQTNAQTQFATVDDLTVYETDDAWLVDSFDISPADLSSTFKSLLKKQNLPFVTPIALAPQNQSILYTATNYLWQWNDTTQQWTSNLGNQDLTNKTQSATVPAITVAPTDVKRIYTGSTDGALYMSTNTGSSWTKLNSGTTALPLAAITSINVNPTNSSDILVGLSKTGLGSGHLWRCRNTLASNPTFVDVSGSGASALPDVSLNAIALDIYTPATTWWVGTDVGVFETTDSGATWTNAGASLGLPNVIVDDLVAVSGTRYLNAGTYGRGMWRLLLANSGPSLLSLSVSPSLVVGGTSSTGTVTLNGAAPSGGAAVQLVSSSVSAQVPAFVMVPAGSTTATFAIATSEVSNSAFATITGTLGDSESATLTISSIGLKGISVSPTSVVGGTSAVGTVMLTGPAPTTGQVIALNSGSVSAQVPSTITISAGATTGTFAITTSGVATSSTVSIGAELGAVSSTTKLTINPATLSGIAVLPNSLTGGSIATGTVTLTGFAPPEGLKIAITSSSVDAKPPASVLIASGAFSASISIPTVSVLDKVVVTISAKEGSVAKTASLTILPVSLQGLTLSTSNTIGDSLLPVTGTVTLSSAAPTNGATVTLSSSKAAVATVPATVKVVSGATSATFAVTSQPVTTSQTVTLKATIGGVSHTASLTVDPLQLSSLSITPASVVGGTSVVGTITLGDAVRVPTSVKLSSNSKAGSVPASVAIPANSSTGTVTIKTIAVTTPTVATVTATLGTSIQKATLTIQPPAILSLSVSPTTIQGNSAKAVTGTVTISGPAPSSGLVVALSSSTPAAATAPKTVTVPAGKTSATFAVKHVNVTALTTVTLTAVLSNVAKTAALTVTP